MSSLKPYKYICGCGAGVRKKLCDDLPGEHSYIWACNGCGQEYGPEWTESHHGAKDLPPELDLAPWSD